MCFSSNTKRKLISTYRSIFIDSGEKLITETKNITALNMTISALQDSDRNGELNVETFLASKIK